MKQFLSIYSAFILITVLMPACKKETVIQEDLHVSMLDAVNRLRHSGCRCGSDSMPPVPALRWNDTLRQAAEAHINDMFYNHYFDHIAPDGSSPVQRAIRLGYTGNYVGENIARGYMSVQDVMAGWKNSEDHCKAMMDTLYREMGAARLNDYWVQEFGGLK